MKLDALRHVDHGCPQRRDHVSTRSLGPTHVD
jgi:hypothetical protein